MPTVAQALAEWSSTLSWSQVPDDLRRVLKLRLLDAVGLMLAAHDLPPGRAARRVALRQGGPAEAQLVVTGDRLPASWAALVHGTLVHSLDFDDTFSDSVVHPSSVVIPVALAVAQETAASGEELLTAASAGYEVAARIGAAAGRAFHARGFQATGVIGPLVAAVVAGRLYRMPPTATAQAMGLAGSMSGGLLEFLSDGSWSKRLHPGWAAHGGIIAAQLGDSGFPGPMSIIEGRHGVYAAFLGPDVADVAQVTLGLGSQWRSAVGHFKFYPCAHVLHPFIEAALAIRRHHDLDPTRIAAIEPVVAPWHVPIVCAPRSEKLAPATEYQARASLPFVLAAALVDGRVDLDTFDEQAIHRPELLGMARLVRETTDQRFDQGFGGRLVLRTTDGRTLQAPPGATTSPSIEERVTEKFTMAAGRALDADRVASLRRVLATAERHSAAYLLSETVVRPPPDRPSTP